MNAVPGADGTRRGRRTLILLFALFFGPILLALVLGLLGLHPAGSKNRGERLEPYADLRALTPQLADGSDYHWNPEQRLWRIAVVAPAGCADACAKLAADIDKVWQLFGKDAAHAQILWIGELPQDAPRTPAWKQVRADPGLLAKLPRSNDPGGAVAYVIDPYGFVVLRYAPGFDPGDLRYDMAKLLKLM
ncbi:hypothetical protein GCM10027084_10920 [Pseudoxanthomonas sangjuensis]|uniref:hypothetical protein n=1 Tax=Pseudoxanthomonas sangjuensis TaxID=1503750 RepID=UPI0013916A33|nr:hypothetical protein [Pseudoxanthomonas sangjuensis]KAF1711921.1 hypothetical protein CSC71_09590 [Pseudoxanthomonas sangjuensis]